MAAPKGNRFGAHDKPWTRALQRHAQQNPDLLRILAVKTFDKAMEGDMAALKEVTERLDGKAAQSIELSGSLETNRPEELTDADLARIAASSSSGTAESPESSSRTH